MVGKIKGKQMQVIIVLHDKDDDDGKGTLKDKIEYTIFEKYNDGLSFIQKIDQLFCLA